MEKESSDNKAVLESEDAKYDLGNIESPKHSHSKRSQSQGSRRRRVKCAHCVFSTPNRALFWSHRLLEHSKENACRFYCGFSSCWFPFPSRREKEAHELLTHGSLHPPFKCPVCGKGLMTRIKLDSHPAKCRHKPVFHCPQAGCDLRTQKFGYLSRHMTRRHNMDLLLLDRDTFTFPRLGNKHYDTFTSPRPGNKHYDTFTSSWPGNSHYETYVTNHGLNNSHSETRVTDLVLDEVPVTSTPPPGLRLPKQSFSCPYLVCSTEYSSRRLLHSHIHYHHLDTGYDMLDCPMGTRENMLSCVCGRRTNCRASLVVHCCRCPVNMGNMDREEKGGVGREEVGEDKKEIVVMNREKLVGVYQGDDSKPDKKDFDKWTVVKICEVLVDSKKREPSVVEVEQGNTRGDGMTDDQLLHLEQGNTGGDCVTDDQLLHLPPARRTSCLLNETRSTSVGKAREVKQELMELSDTQDDCATDSDDQVLNLPPLRKTHYLLTKTRSTTSSTERKEKRGVDLTDSNDEHVTDDQVLHLPLVKRTSYLSSAASKAREEKEVVVVSSDCSSKDDEEQVKQYLSGDNFSGDLTTTPIHVVDILSDESVDLTESGTDLKDSLPPKKSNLDMMSMLAGMRSSRTDWKTYRPSPKCRKLVVSSPDRSGVPM